MTRPTYNLSLRDRNLIRLGRYMRIENFHAQRMAEHGDVEIFEMEADLDTEHFPYRFEKVGKHSIQCLKLSDQGKARLRELYETKRDDYQAYQRGCCVGQYGYLEEQILYTPFGIETAVNTGYRDRLLAFNRKVTDDSYFKIEERAVDPDTFELLLTNKQIDDLWFEQQ